MNNLQSRGPTRVSTHVSTMGHEFKGEVPICTNLTKEVIVGIMSGTFLETKG